MLANLDPYDPWQRLELWRSFGKAAPAAWVFPAGRQHAGVDKMPKRPCRGSLIVCCTILACLFAQAQTPPLAVKAGRILEVRTGQYRTQQTILIEGGRLLLGRWQSVFFAEFDGPRMRELRVKIVHDPA